MAERQKATGDCARSEESKYIIRIPTNGWLAPDDQVTELMFPTLQITAIRQALPRLTNADEATDEERVHEHNVMEPVLR